MPEPDVILLTRTICRQAGLDFEDAGGTLPAERRNYRFPAGTVSGYGAHFKRLPRRATGPVEEILLEETDHWNRRECSSLHLSHAAFDGWTIGSNGGDFIYFTHPREPLPRQQDISSRQVEPVILAYQACPHQAAALDRFLAGLRIDPGHHGLTVAKGALRITYFQG